MKLVHINKKDLEKERKMLEFGNEIMRAQAAREYQQFLKRREKLRMEQAQKSK